MSDIPLAGAITAIDMAQLHRTSERRIIAGADDGSIAIFSYEYVRKLL